MKRLPHIPKSGRSKTVLSLAICLCFGTAAVTSGFGQNKPKPTSIEEKTKIHRLATTKRAIYDAFAYMNRIPEKAEEEMNRRKILGNLLTQLPSPLKYLIQRAGGNAVSLGYRLFY